MKIICIYILNICFLISCKGLESTDSGVSTNELTDLIHIGISNINIESELIEFVVDNNSDTNYLLDTHGLTWRLALKDADATDSDWYIERVGYIERIYPKNIERFILIRSGEKRIIKIKTDFFEQFVLKKQHRYILSSRYYSSEEIFSRRKALSGGQKALSGEIAISPYEFLYR